MKKIAGHEVALEKLRKELAERPKLKTGDIVDIEGELVMVTASANKYGGRNVILSHGGYGSFDLDELEEYDRLGRFTEVFVRRDVLAEDLEDMLKNTGAGQWRYELKVRGYING